MAKTLSFLTLFLIVSAFSASRLVKTKLPAGVTVSVPDTMYPMTQDDIAQRYPSVRAPLGAFTDQNRMADFSVNISATKWPDGDLDLAGKFFKSGLSNLYDKIDLISEGKQVVHKKTFIYYEFESRISGDRRRQGYTDPILKYTFIQYLVEKDRTLVFTFSCPKDQREEWQDVAKEIMKSVRVTGKQ